MIDVDAENTSHNQSGGLAHQESLVTLQGVAKNKDYGSKQSSVGDREQADEFSLFMQPLDGNNENNNPFHEVN